MHRSLRSGRGGKNQGWCLNLLQSIEDWSQELDLAWKCNRCDFCPCLTPQLASMKYLLNPSNGLTLDSCLLGAPLRSKRGFFFPLQKLGGGKNCIYLLFFFFNWKAWSSTCVFLVKEPNSERGKSFFASRQTHKRSEKIWRVKCTDRSRAKIRLALFSSNFFF